MMTDGYKAKSFKGVPIAIEHHADGSVTIYKELVDDLIVALEHDGPEMYTTIKKEPCLNEADYEAGYTEGYKYGYNSGCIDSIRFVKKKLQALFKSKTSFICTENNEPLTPEDETELARYKAFREWRHNIPEYLYDISLWERDNKTVLSVTGIDDITFGRLIEAIDASNTDVIVMTPLQVWTLFPDIDFDRLYLAEKPQPYFEVMLRGIPVRYRDA